MCGMGRDVPRNPSAFDVIARRIDAGARWELEVPDVPGACVEVIDLIEGSVTIRSVLAERLGQPAEELEVRIILA